MGKRRAKKFRRTELVDVEVAPFTLAEMRAALEQRPSFDMLTLRLVATVLALSDALVELQLATQGPAEEAPEGLQH